MYGSKDLYVPIKTCTYTYLNIYPLDTTCWHTSMVVYLCELSWDWIAHWQHGAGWDIAGVSLCLSAQPSIAAI